MAFTSHDRKQDLPRKTASQSSLLINRLTWMSQATRSQTWEPVKPGVPKEVKGGYPETKILRVG